MPVPSGLIKTESQETGNPRYNIFMSFANMDSNPRIRLAHEKMCELDEKLIDDGVKNHMSWLRQPDVPDRKVVEALYNRRVRVSRDKETLKKLDYPDSVSITVPTDKDGNIRVETFDENQQPINPIEALQKGCKAIVVAECNGVWFPQNKISMSFRAANIQIFPPERLTGFSIRQEEDDEEVKSDELRKGESSFGDDDKGDDDKGEDGEDGDNDKEDPEFEGDPDVEPEPEPVKTVKKPIKAKRGRARK